MKKANISSTIVFVCSLGLSGFLAAETVKIPVGQDTAEWTQQKPKRGITKAQVERQFGAPTSKQGPSGEPPIYFWEYPDFTVYFEADYVIHTVVKKRN